MSAHGQEGRLRLLTLGEIAMARRVYGESIQYGHVWIHCDSYFPFGMQFSCYAMTPNGEMWFRELHHTEDFAATHVFI